MGYSIAETAFFRRTCTHPPVPKHYRCRHRKRDDYQRVRFHTHMRTCSTSKTRQQRPSNPSTTPRCESHQGHVRHRSWRKKRKINVLEGNRSRTHLGVGMLWLHHQQSLEDLGQISQVKGIVALRWRWQQLVRDAFVDFYRGCYQRFSHRLQTGNSCF